jgi:hypothetical protein
MFNFESVDDPPINEQFSQVGYGNKMIVQNMGSFWLITNMLIAWTLAITLISCLPLKYICCCGKSLQERTNRFMQSVYWNGVIKFIDQNYLCLLIMSLIGL